MAEKRPNEAPEVRSRDPLVVEDTEVRIIELAKRAMLYNYSLERYAEEVNKIIDGAQKDIKSDTLRPRIVAPLRKYALDTLNRERRLMYERALFYSAVMMSLTGSTDVVKARELKRNVLDKDYTAELIESQGFKEMLQSLKSPLPPFDGAAWRMRADNYRQGLPLDVFYKRYNEAVKETLSEIVGGDAREEYGVNINLRNIAEMTVRYDHQLDMVNGLRDSGVKLVYIVPHANCSKRCEKYQVGGSMHPTGLYSLDGSTGKTADGIFYRPLEFATDNPIDEYVTREGRVYQNGCITGFNCRHILQPYRPKETVRAIPTAVIERRREVEERQRAYEREIRYQKRLAVQASGVNNALAKRARKRARALNAAYERFSEKNRVAFYRERTRILDDESLFRLRPSDASKLK